LPRPCRLFLFDLDGTLIDSKEDIARAANAALTGLGHHPLSVPDLLPFVGDGINALIHRVLLNAGGAEPDSHYIAAGVELMLQAYNRHICDSTRLYPGVRETLDRLHWARFGLITNKPEALTRRLLQVFNLADRFSLVLGGDSLPQRKPDPAPLLEAMARTGIPPGETVMVGDSRTDVLAGKAADVTTCGVSYGFRSREELVAAGCDLIIDEFAGLLLAFCAPAASGPK